MFETPVGVFSFTRVPQNVLFAGVRRCSVEGGHSFFLAEPLKSLADYVHVHACNWHGAEPVVASLRVDPDALGALKAESFEALLPVYRSGRVRRFLEELRKDLGL